MRAMEPCQNLERSEGPLCTKKRGWPSAGLDQAGDRALLNQAVDRALLDQAEDRALLDQADDRALLDQADNRALRQALLPQWQRQQRRMEQGG